MKLRLTGTYPIFSPTSQFLSQKGASLERASIVCSLAQGCIVNFGAIVLIVDDLIVRRRAEQSWIGFGALDIPQMLDGLQRARIRSVGQHMLLKVGRKPSRRSQGRHEERYGIGNFSVITVTPTKRRRPESLREAARRRISV